MYHDFFFLQNFSYITPRPEGRGYRKVRPSGELCLSGESRSPNTGYLKDFANRLSFVKSFATVSFTTESWKEWLPKHLASKFWAWVAPSSCLMSFISSSDVRREMWDARRRGTLPRARMRRNASPPRRRRPRRRTKAIAFVFTARRAWFLKTACKRT